MTLVEQLAQFEVKHIDLAGVQQSYREAGQGPDLVLLHGISSGSGAWLKQLQALSPHFHVLAWDAPGYGQSDVLATDQPNALDYAHRLKAWLDALGVKQVILLGHSLGAMQAAAFQASYPEYVRALILANPAQGYYSADAAQQAEVYAKRPQMLQQLGAIGMAKLRGPHLAAHCSAEVLHLITVMMQGIGLAGFTAASYLLAYDAIKRYLRPQQAHTHVIKAMLDGITPPQDIQDLADQFQLQSCYALEQAGHLSYLDQATQFNQILLSLHDAKM